MLWYQRILCRIGLHRWSTWTATKTKKLYDRYDYSCTGTPIGTRHYFRRACERCNCPDFGHEDEIE